MFKKTKKVLGLLLALTLLASLPVMAESQKIEALYNAVLIRVNGSYLNAPSYLYNNLVYVPLRAVSEAMGAEVLWDGETQSIAITTNVNEPKMETKAFSINEGENLSVEAYPNYFKISIDGKELALPHFLNDGTTYVPVSVFYDHFGCHVMQHQPTMSVRIYEPGYKTFGDDEVFYINDTAYTTAEVLDISNTVIGVSNPTTLTDYAYVEDFLLSHAAVEIIGEKMVPKEGFEEYCKTTFSDPIFQNFEFADKEAFIQNVVLDFYYRENLNDANVENYFKPTDEMLAEHLKTTDYGTGRWLKAKHILINKTADGSGLAQAEEILTILKDHPEQFDTLMKTHSTDPGSVAQPDGYLFTEGQMVTEFYEGTLPLQIGEISGIVESQYGYHIILKVADYENGVPLDEAKDEIKALYLNGALNNLYTELMAQTDTVLNRSVIENIEK